MKIVLINLLYKKIDDCTNLKNKYGLRDPSYHILSGKIEAYSEIIELLNGGRKRVE